MHKPLEFEFVSEDPNTSVMLTNSQKESFNDSNYWRPQGDSLLLASGLQKPKLKLRKFSSSRSESIPSVTAVIEDWEEETMEMMEMEMDEETLLQTLIEEEFGNP